MSFGMLAGTLGGKIGSPRVEKVSGIALAAMSVMLVIEGWRVVEVGGYKSPCRTLGKMYTRLQPALLGFVSGLTLCPPFLAAVVYVFGLGSALKGAAFFLFYFAGIIVFQVPLALAGPVAGRRSVRFTAQATALAAGSVLFCTGVRMVL